MIAGIALAASSLAGCGENEAAPPAPSLEGGTARPGIGAGGDRDGGRGDAARDAGGSDAAGLPLGCIDARDDTDNGVVVTEGDGTAVAFRVTRAYARWNPADCDTDESERLLLVGVTEDACEPGIGQRLVLQLAGDQLGTGIAPGTAPVALSEFVDVLYIEPPEEEGAARLWANCAGSDGSLTFEEVGSEVGDRLRGSLDATLVDCRTSPTLPPRHLRGTFHVVLERSFEESCVPAP